MASAEDPAPEAPKRRAGIAALIGGVLYGILHFADVGGGIAIIFRYGWWFVPYHLAFMTAWTVAILAGSGLIMRRWPKWQARLTFDPTRFKSRFWSWVFTRGAFLTAVLLATFVSAIPSTAFVRFTGITGKRAWLYALAANVIATLAMFVFWRYLFVFVRPQLAHLRHLLH